MWTVSDSNRNYSVQGSRVSQLHHTARDVVFITVNHSIHLRLDISLGDAWRLPGTKDVTLRRHLQIFFRIMCAVTPKKHIDYPSQTIGGY